MWPYVSICIGISECINGCKAQQLEVTHAHSMDRTTEQDAEVHHRAAAGEQELVSQSVASALGGPSLVRFGNEEC